MLGLLGTLDNHGEATHLLSAVRGSIQGSVPSPTQGHEERDRLPVGALDLRKDRMLDVCICVGVSETGVQFARG